jgi:endonuclease III
LGALLVQTLYFSHTRGIKMDTTEKELKQGAIADLLQQKPAASSDEERLAAGISTIGLQTKRLSGAQRMSRKVIEKEQTLAFSIDPESHRALANLNFKAFWGLGRIIFRTLKEEKKHPKNEVSSSKSSPQ